MIRFRYIVLMFCLAMMLTLVACERDLMIIGSLVEGIQVTGTGSAFGDPDIAVLSLGITAQEATIEAAQEAAAFAMQQVLESLESNGVAQHDIQTQQFSIRPVYTYKSNLRELQGYQVSNIVAIKARDIDETGKIIDDAVTAGGKWMIVNSVSFAIDEPESLLEQARAAAMKDAKAKAQALAGLGDVVLGKPVSISENVGNPPAYRYDESSVATKDGSATPIRPGELEIIVNVTVVYDIE